VFGGKWTGGGKLGEGRGLRVRRGEAVKVTKEDGWGRVCLGGVDARLSRVGSCWG